MKKNDSKSLGTEFIKFKPTITFSLIYIVLCTLSLVALFKAISMFALPAITVIRQLIMMLSWGLQVITWIICTPLVRHFFSVTIDRDGITSLNGLTPINASRATLPWKTIKNVQMKNYLFFTFIVVSDGRQLTNLYIPKDLEDYKKFLMMIKKLAPANNPMRILLQLYKQTHNGNQKNLYSKEVSLSGRVITKGNKESSFMSLKLKHGDILINEFKTDMQGKFLIVTQLIPGTYHLIAETLFEYGEVQLQVDGPRVGGIQIEVRRKSA